MENKESCKILTGFTYTFINYRKGRLKNEQMLHFEEVENSIKEIKNNKQRYMEMFITKKREAGKKKRQTEKAREGKGLEDLRGMN